MTTPSRARLFWLTLPRLLAGILVLGCFAFLPAGTFNYWEAWVFLAVLFAPIIALFIYLLMNDLELLERRMNLKEREAPQKAVIAAFALVLVILFVLPGFDERWSWSEVPVWAVLLADLGILAGFAMYMLVLRVNRYAARTVEVMKDQPVIQTGPYGIVRHPMYSAMSLIFIFSPLALGSWWISLLALLVLPLLGFRAVKEEELLKRDLNGYAEYMQKVRFRLIPGVW
jgi:protein-S-isoprenylcysteine O-methyltransferase Ste14